MQVNARPVIYRVSVVNVVVVSVVVVNVISVVNEVDVVG